MLKYKAALTNVKFDNSCRNVLRFDSRSEQESYFSVSDLFSNAVEINFNVGDLLTTTITYIVKDSESITNLMSKNYCIIKDECDNKTLDFYYFFVEEALQDSANQLRLKLKLDIFQTYYIDATFTDCQINRAHLNRFVETATYHYYKFDTALDSKLFEREDLQNIPKRHVERVKVSLNRTLSIVDDAAHLLDNPINTWLDEHVAGWLYAFVDPAHEFKFYKSDGNIMIKKLTDDGGMRIFAKSQTFPTEAYQNAIDTMLDVIAFPVFKGDSSKLIVKYGSNQITMNAAGLEDFMYNNNQAAYITALKYSKMPPFSPNAYYANGLADGYTGDPGAAVYYEISDGGKTLTLSDEHWVQTETWFVDLLNVRAVRTGLVNGGLNVKYQFPSVITKEIALAGYPENIKFRFSHDEIVGVDKNPNLNPKLLNGDYLEVRISEQNGDSFAYEYLKMGESNFKIEYTEPIVADFNASYSRIFFENTNQESVYGELNNTDLTGVLSKQDTTLPLFTSAWQSSLAQQKNFVTQTNFDIASSSIQNILNDLAFKNYKISKNNSKQGIDTIGSGQNIANTLYGTGESLIDFGFTIDNMKNAPSSVKNVSSSPILQESITDCSVFVDVYQILPNEQKIVNDFMDMFGFTVNLIGNVKDYDNIRKYHNFVRANLQEISGVNLSNKVRQAFVSCFANGVRFWNVDTFSYEKENYEKWLEK